MADGDAVEPSTGPEHEFLRLACLEYGRDDSPAAWNDASALLAAHPDLAGASIHVAAADCDLDAVRALLARDPDAASRRGGPIDWEPILYLAYARHAPDVAVDAVLGTTRLLLEHGADPNAGYLWHGTYPFTAITGVFGGGELGLERQPPHPHAAALATVLLDAGAEANDSQALYNRQFFDDDTHLEVLLAHGLGTGDGGPWRARLGHAAASPRALVRTQLWWALTHDQRARVRLLADHGVDLSTPFDADDTAAGWMSTGLTPCEVAAMTGAIEMVEDLVARGARPPSLTGVDAFVAAALAGDAGALSALDDVVAEARVQRPGLVVWAAGLGRRDAIPLLVEHGFDVNALGRSDVPIEEPWQTALHTAAAHDDVELVRVLLDLGADPDLHDARFDSTPLGWARHEGHQRVADLLEALT